MSTDEDDERRFENRAEYLMHDLGIEGQAKRKMLIDAFRAEYERGRADEQEEWDHYDPMDD